MHLPNEREHVEIVCKHEREERGREGGGGVKLKLTLCYIDKLIHFKVWDQIETNLKL